MSIKDKRFTDIDIRGISLETGEWVYGFGIIKYPNDDTAIIYTKNKINDPNNPYIWIPVRPETISEYTGIKDKYNKKIYELEFVKDDKGREGIIIKVAGGFIIHWTRIPDGTEGQDIMLSEFESELEVSNRWIYI